MGDRLKRRQKRNGTRYTRNQWEEGRSSRQQLPRSLPPPTEHGELDLVFAFDCTGSMGAHLQQAQANVKNIARQIIEAEHASVRMALVAYRDHPPQESSFETEVLDFTPSIDEMEAKLMTYSAQGGGDGPECVADALYQVSQLSYRPNAAKVCILIADAPPHGLGESGDGFPNGSPNGHDPYTVSRLLAAMGVTVYCVGVEPVLSSSYRFARTFFESVAEATHGQYVTLGSSKMLASVIIGGAAEELALERLMAAARKELEEGARTGAVSLDDEVACKAYLSEQIKAKGFRSKQLTRNGKSLERHSEEAKEWSKCASLSEVREKTAGISAATASTSVRRCSSPSASMAFCAPMMSRAPMPMPMAVESDAWACTEAEVSEEQCERLYSKIRSRA
jgi:Mg-chelatase subunit ChlD